MSRATEDTAEATTASKSFSLRRLPIKVQIEVGEAMEELEETGNGRFGESDQSITTERVLAAFTQIMTANGLDPQPLVTGQEQPVDDTSTARLVVIVADALVGSLRCDERDKLIVRRIALCTVMKALQAVLTDPRPLRSNFIAVVVASSLPQLLVEALDKLPDGEEFDAEVRRIIAMLVRFKEEGHDKGVMIVPSSRAQFAALSRSRPTTPWGDISAEEQNALLDVLRNRFDSDGMFVRDDAVFEGLLAVARLAVSQLQAKRVRIAELLRPVMTELGLSTEVGITVVGSIPSLSDVTEPLQVQCFNSENGGGVAWTSLDGLVGMSMVNILVARPIGDMSDSLRAMIDPGMAAERH